MSKAKATGKAGQSARAGKAAQAGRAAKPGKSGFPVSNRAKPTVQNSPTGRGPKRKVAAGGGRRGGIPVRSPGRVHPIGPAVTAPAIDGKAARQTAESAEAAKAAIDAALDKKALLPVLIDVSSMASYTDFIGIVSGRSDRQVDAIAEGVLAAMKARGRSLLGHEGSGSGRWTLDFGDIVIHVFYHPVREFYDLESLWVDAPRIPLKIPPEAVMAQPDALYGNL